MSNIIPKFEPAENAGAFKATFRDLTGQFDPVENPGGLGTPNYDIGDITAIVLIVDKPDVKTGRWVASGITVDLFALGYMVSASFVTVPADLIGNGVNSKWYDGAYRFQIKISVGAEDFFSKQIVWIFKGGVECCILHKRIQMKNCKCNQFSETEYNGLRGDLALKVIEAANECQDYENGMCAFLDARRVCNTKCKPCGGK